MRDHAAKPAIGELLDCIEQVLPERPRPRLDQEPPAAHAERHALEHLVGELLQHRLGDLPRGDDAHVEALALQFLVEGLRAALQLLGHHDPVVRVDVRRRADQSDAVALRDARHLDAVVEVACAVVEPGEDVAVEVDHCVQYRWLQSGWT